MKSVAADTPRTTRPARDRDPLRHAPAQPILLSNGEYNVRLSEVGSGCSELGDVAITRWAGDETRDADLLKDFTMSILTSPLQRNPHQVTRRRFLRGTGVVMALVMTATLLPILAVLLLTLLAMGAWLFRIPSELTGLPTALFLLGGFAIFFLVAAAWPCRRLLAAPGAASARPPSLFGNIADPANLSVQLPALSATLPFFLLIMVTLRLPLGNPSAVFGLALLAIGNFVIYRMVNFRF